MLKKILGSFYHKILDKLSFQINEQLQNTTSNLSGEQTAQQILKNQYRQLTPEEVRKYHFNDVGFRKYSQNSEDGILLFIFSIIGTTNRQVIEVCSGNGIECNAANLIINHGWQGLLFDGNEEEVKKGQKFYNNHRDTFTLPPKLISAWITKDNINDLISKNGVNGEIDLLSIDMDGVDYWIWKEIHVVQPRVVVAEIQCIFGSEDAVTVPYSPDFKTKFEDGFGIYCGASLQAFINLGKQKGYRLVGFEKYGFNAFFMRNDIANDVFPEYDYSSYEQIPFVKWAKGKFLNKIKDLDWEQV